MEVEKMLDQLINHNDENIEYYASIEGQIAENLDYFLRNHGDKIMNLPTHILYNIFKHQNRILNNHDLAYDLINQQFEKTQNEQIFILYLCLDGSKICPAKLDTLIENAEKSIRSFHNVQIDERNELFDNNEANVTNKMDKIFRDPFMQFFSFKILFVLAIIIIIVITIGHYMHRYYIKKYDPFSYDNLLKMLMKEFDNRLKILLNETKNYKSGAN